MDFVHLHVHTEYSLLDGAIRTKDLAKKVAGWNQKAVAITDHGVLYGAVEFYENCNAQGIKPILGCEAYICSDGITCRERKKNNHLLLLAENNTGWHNLMKLISIANTEGFYYKPRIDIDCLTKYGEGIIASSACLAGEIPQYILNGDMDKAKECAERYKYIMGKNNFYLEIMPNSLPQQKTVNEAILQLSKDCDIPVIATGDAHYLNESDYGWHKTLLKINTHADPNDDAFGFSQNDFYLKSPEEFEEKFKSICPDALENTVKIAERCNVELPMGAKKQYILPQVILADGETEEEKLRTKVYEGLKERFETLGRGEIPQEYLTRLEHELSVIKEMGFVSYFLIVSGIIQRAKSENIPIGPGRGSAAGSLVAWSLKITELDPLKYNLIFERFLNPERVSMPDIDTDVSDKGRDKLLKIISQTYGADHVAQIITFGRMKGRQSVKDVGRAVGVDYNIMDKTAKMIPATSKNLNEAIESTPELKKAIDENQTLRDVINTAKSIEGLARHTSQHAAGVVITPEPITNYVPVKKITKGNIDKNEKEQEISQIITQFTMEPVEKLGLVKMDFLGLSTLSIIEEALNNIKHNKKPFPDMNKVNDELHDERTFKLLQEGDTTGVFQLESDGLRAMLRKLKVDRFEDLIAALAMYRPGPLESGMVDQYIDCKHGRAQPHYLHPMLENTLKDTYGVILYQEQVMQCASVLAGYTLGQADLLRRAMGKKKVEVMQAERARFVEGALKNNIDEKTASNIFDIIEKFAGYGFNKSHSAAYALISYDTAWLKTNYKTEFMAAYLSSQMKAKKEVLGRYVTEVRQSGIKVLSPDINTSMESFTPVGEVIRFGLGAVKRVGHNTVEMIVKERESHGKFVSFWDFVKRVDMKLINKAVFENLIKAGAFDEISNNRAALINAVPLFLKAVQNITHKKDDRQIGLFDSISDDAAVDEPRIPNVNEYDEHEKLNYEKEVTGLYISGHPYEKHQKEFEPYVNCSIGDLQDWKSSKIKPCFGGIITSVTEKTTKKNNKAMCTFQIEDDENNIEVVIFPKAWPDFKEKVNKDTACIIEGKIGEKGNFILDRLITESELSEENMQKYTIVSIDASKVENFDDEKARKLLSTIHGCKGDSKLILEIKDYDEIYRVCLSSLVDGEKINVSLASLTA